MYDLELPGSMLEKINDLSLVLVQRLVILAAAGKLGTSLAKEDGQGFQKKPATI